MLNVRRMTEADVPCAAALEAACFSEPWSEKSFLDAIRDRNTLYLVAEDCGKIVGMCGLWQSFEEADVMNVAVDPAFRRCGVADALMGNLFLLGKERGISAFTLEVRSSNRPAIALYEKLGFVTEGIRKNFYSKPVEDALIMWKR